jgi:hypothetical protein
VDLLMKLKGTIEIEGIPNGLNRFKHEFSVWWNECSDEGTERIMTRVIEFCQLSDQQQH